MATPHFAGTRDFATTPEKLYAMVTDIDAIAATMPNVVESEKVDERTLKATVKPGLAFLRGTMKLTIRLGEMDPPRQAVMYVEGQGIGVKMRIRSQVEIEPAEGGARLAWHSSLEEMSGLVASVGPGLVRAAAETVMKQGWDAIAKRVETT